MLALGVCVGKDSLLLSHQSYFLCLLRVIGFRLSWLQNLILWKLNQQFRSGSIIEIDTGVYQLFCQQTNQRIDTYPPLFILAVDLWLYRSTTKPQQVWRCFWKIYFLFEEGLWFQNRGAVKLLFSSLKYITRSKSYSVLIYYNRRYHDSWCFIKINWTTASVYLVCDVLCFLDGLKFTPALKAQTHSRWVINCTLLLLSEVKGCDTICCFKLK